MTEYMPNNMYDMFRQFTSENPEESRMWKKHVGDVLNDVSVRHPGAPLTNEMLENMIDDVMRRTGMDEPDMEVMDMANEPAIEVFAQGSQPFRNRGHFHNRFHHRFHNRFFPRDFARFLLLSELLG